MNIEKELELNSEYYYFCIQLLLLLETYFHYQLYEPIYPLGSEV